MSINKSWERPWTMEEIIENANNWNLAGDVALLNTLKSFADKLVTQSTEINDNLNNLTNNLNETSLRLNIAQNEFGSLRNSQFIESRVYEDDETLPQKENNEKVSKDEAEIDHTEDIKVAAMKGLQVLDQYFDKIQVSVSDSEDDDIDLPNYVLRAKDLYLDRPLPYVIGSEEWHKNWHVGLEESSSESETEKFSDKFSESDEDLPLNNSMQIKNTSDTSSELDFSQKTEPKATISSDSDNSVPVSSTQNFAEELAAKLGNVIEQNYVEPEVNRRPIQPAKSNFGDLFFDEPPPLDDNKGLFSGGTGLFDDEDDEFSTPVESIKAESPKLAKKTSSGLFDEASSDEDIFSNKPPVATNKTQTPLFSEEPPAIVGERKKPVGGVSLFGGANLFDKKLPKRQPSFSDEEAKKKDEESNKKIDLFSDDVTKTNQQTKKVNLFESDEEKDDKVVIKSAKEEKKMSLFDDDDDLFKDDLFASATNTKKKFTSGLFDDIDDQTDDLFSNRSEVKPSNNLFEDLMPSIPDNKNSINNNDTSREKSVTNLLEDGPGIEQICKSEPEKPKPRISLFDSPPPEPDDLFGENFSFEKKSEKTEDNESNVFEKNEKQVTSLFDQDDLFFDKQKTFTSSTPTAANRIRLFDPSPPPDDDWETKSETMSEENDSLTDHDNEEIATQHSNLFDDEPSPLDSPKKLSDITENVEKQPEEVKSLNISSPGKLKHNLKINVGALMPGSKPPKRVEGEPINTKTSPSFDTTDNVQVLHSVTKDRPRVPSLNRRPSTRRGRKAAMQNTAVEVKMEEEVYEDTNKEIDSVKKTEDLFGTEKPSKGAKIDLFDDEDDDSDIFSSKKPVQPTETLKKSLFDDEDNEEDDIFKSFSVAKKTESKLATERKIPKVSSVKKLENTKPDDDPLSALLK